MAIIIKLFKSLPAYFLAIGFIAFFVAIYEFHNVDLRSNPFLTFGSYFAVAYGVVSLIITIFAALPALFAIIFAQYNAIKSGLYFITIATLVGASLPYVFFEYFGGGRDPYFGLTIVGIILGPFAGLIYWQVAGKSAGFASHLRGPDAPSRGRI